MQRRFTDKLAEILLIEDNQADGHLAKYILEDISVNTKVKLVDDGVKALSYLRKETPYFDATRPDLIILDLNMPRKGGFEVLQELKEDRNLSKIPVVVLTTSTSSDFRTFTARPSLSRIASSWYANVSSSPTLSPNVCDPPSAMMRRTSRPAEESAEPISAPRYPSEFVCASMSNSSPTMAKDALGVRL